MLFLFCFHVFSFSPFSGLCYCQCLGHMCPCVAILFEFRFFSHTPVDCSFELIFGFRFNFMEEPRLTLFLAVDRSLRHAFDSFGSVPMSIVNPGGYYIGLREDWYEAVLRARLFANGAEVTSESHILLKIQFSAAGFMHYSTTSAGRAYAFSPVLYKKVYSKETGDWKVWHFLGDLPMRWEASPGVLLVSSEWREIPETGILL